MSVVLHLYVCPFVSKRDKRKWYLCETPTYFNNLKYFVYVMCYYVVWGCLHMSFNFGIHISITYQNSPKLVFYLFLWVQAFGLV